MRRLRKMLLWITLGMLGILLLLVVGALLLPVLVNLESIKENTLADLSEKVGGEVAFESLHLSILPHPRVVIHKGTLAIPGKAKGKLESLVIYPRILPLLVGKLRFDKLLVDHPAFQIVLKQSPENTNAVGQKPASFPEIKEKMGAVLALLAEEAPGLLIEIDHGRFNLSGQEGSIFRSEGIKMSIAFPPDKLKIELACESTLWESLSLEVWLNSQDLDGKGQLEMSQLNAGMLLEYLHPHSEPDLEGSQVNLNISFSTERLQAFHARVKGSVPNLTWRRAKEPMVLKCRNIDAELDLNDQSARVTLADLDLEYPKVRFSGAFQMDKKAPLVLLELEGRDVDVPSARTAGLTLAGHVETIQTIFDIIKGGQVPLVTFRSSAKSIGELDQTENMVITGSIRNGEVFVPGAEVETNDVSAEAVVSKGILEGKNIEARLENQQVHDGKLQVGLEGDEAPLHVEAMVEADLSLLPPLLKRLIEDKILVDEIGRLHDVTGHASGRLIVGENLANAKVKVEATEISLSAGYEGIPYGLNIEGGQLVFDENRVELINVRGSLGKSSFSGLTAKLDFEKEPYIEVVSADASIILEEIYAWVSSHEGLEGALKGVKSLNGMLSLSMMGLKGPILRPAQWRFRTTGQVDHLISEISFVPGLLKVAGGRFEATPDSLSLSGFRLDIMDATLQISGKLNGYLNGLESADLKTEGNMGPDAVQWVSSYMDLPPELKVRAPLIISDAHLTWEESSRNSFSGRLAVRDGPSVTLDLLTGPHEIRIKHLEIQDEYSRASLALELKEKEREIHLVFKGNLVRQTFDKLLVENNIPFGSMEGDFQTHILLNRPMSSVFVGRLNGKRVGPHLRLKSPLLVEDFTLVAKEKELSVEPALITWGENHLNLAGTVALAGENFLLDMNLSADGLDWAKVENLMKEEGVEGGPDGEGSHWTLPIEGHLRIRANQFTYERLTWEPFHVDISFGRGDQVTVSVTEANLCGVATPGVLNFTPQGTSLDFHPSASGQELQPCISCLSHEKKIVSGRFDLQGEITGQAQTEEWIRSLSGPFEFHAEKGRIYQDVTFSKILAVINVTEIFKGSLSEFQKQGFGYYDIQVKGNLEGGKLIVQEAVLDGVTLDMAGEGLIDLREGKMNFTCVVVPFKSMSAIIRRIPLIGYLTGGGSILSVGVKIEGDPADPQVRLLAAREVGKGILATMKRTLALPIKIVEPFKKGD